MDPTEPQEDLQVIFENHDLRTFYCFLFNAMLWTTYPFQMR